MTDGTEEVPFQVLAGCLVVSLPRILDRVSRARIGELLVNQAHRAAVRGVIVDLTRVDVLDVEDIDWLDETARMCSVIGAPAVICGMSAAIAGAVVQLDARTNALHTVANIEAALTALHRTGARAREGGHG